MTRYLIIFVIFMPLIASQAIEIKIETSNGALHGTLEKAGDGNKSPFALIISGSGATDRDGNSAVLPGANNSLKYLSEGLLKTGISSLRFDKRGIGASKSASLKESDLLFETYVQDVVEWIRFLKKDQGYQNVFVIGHSEGSLIGMIAAQKEPIRGFISIAGPARPASAIILDQARPQLPPELLKKTESILDQLNQGQTVPDAPIELHALFRPSVQPYLISWFKYDPSKEIAKLMIPTLILQGTTDIQVPTSEADFLHKSKKDSELVVIEGMNHVLKSVDSDLIKQTSSYSDPSLPINEKLVSAIGSFIHKNVKGSP
jgi:uncharacterized protein